MQQPLSGEAYAAWVAAQPPHRIASDVRTSTIYLRADHRVGPVALIGAGLGGSHALEQVASPSMYVAAIVLCPSACPKFSTTSAPLLTVFDRGGRHDTDASSASEALLAFKQHEQAAAEADLVLDLEAEVDAEPEVDVKMQEQPAQPAPASRAVARVPSRSALGRLRVHELRQRLETLGLSSAGLKRELAARLHDALVAQRSAASPTTSTAPTASTTPPAAARARASYRAAYRVADRSGGTPSAQRERHLVVQFAGALHWCGDSRSAAYADAAVAGDLEDACNGPDAAGDAASSAANVGGADPASGAFREGAFGEEVQPTTVNEAEDAMLMVEAWLNLHFDREQMKR